MCWPPASFVYACDSMILRSYGPGVPALGQNQSVRGWNTGKSAAGSSSQEPSLICGLVGLGENLQVVGTGYILHCLFVYLYLFRTLAKDTKQAILVKGVQVPSLPVSFSSLLPLSLLPTASHHSVNTCPPRAGGTSPAHLSSDTFMTLRVQQQYSSVCSEGATWDQGHHAETLFTDKCRSDGGFLSSIHELGWDGALLHFSVARGKTELFSIL